VHLSVIVGQDSTRGDEHQQMLARLEWELHERKRLTGEKDALVQEIRSLKDDIDKRQEYLDSLQPSLNTLLKVETQFLCVQCSLFVFFTHCYSVVGFFACARIYGYAFEQGEG
jgi:siderophore synthetase component